MNRELRNRALNIGVILAFAAVLSAQDKGKELVWPTSPDKARIQYVETISSLEKFQPKKSFLSKLFGFITGGDRPSPWLVQPVGIAVGPDGRIFVADPGANCIHILDLAEGKYDAITETRYGKFLSPVGIAFSDDGSMYVSDSKRGDVILFDHDLNAQGEIRSPLDRPAGLLVLKNRLYVVDVGNHDVAVFDLSGKFLSSFGRRGSADGEFIYPVSLAGHDSVYVVDALNYRIQKFSPDGIHSITFGTQGTVAGKFASPKGVALDSDSDVYVTDALMDNFQIFDSQGRLLLVVGQHGSQPGEFMSPGGIAIDSGNRIYIVETLNKRIQIFQYLK